eukprot:2633971-Heterocapsa_arctica.AAC.1
MSKMKTKLPESELSEILYIKMQNSTELKEDLAHYNRQPEDSLDRSYDYLIRSMERNIDLAQQKKNRASDSAAIRAGVINGKGTALPAPEEGSKAAAKKAKKAAAKALAVGG